MTTSLFIIVFALCNRVTQLDSTGPHEMFWRLPGAQCVATSAVGGETHAGNGFTISNVQRLADIPYVNLICVPGGFGVIEAMEDAEFVRQVRCLADGARYVASVCNGPLALGATGLLQSKRAACYWAWRNLLPAFGATVDEARVMRDGNLTTDGDVIVDVDMALTVTADIADAEHAQAVQLGIEYVLMSPFDCGRPERAAPEILAAVTSRLNYLRTDHHDAVQRAAQRL